VNEALKGLRYRLRTSSGSLAIPLLANDVVRFVFVRWAHRPRRWLRLDRVAKHRRCVVIIQTDPTGAAATAATSSPADSHSQPCAPPVSAGILTVEDVERR
jgi:hypothetical protein